MDSPQKPRVCISVCEPTLPALELAIAAAAEACDLIEVRLDCLNPLELETDAALVTKLLKEADCESILTFRPLEQGGLRSLDDETRHAFWSGAIFSESFFDVELDLPRDSILLKAHRLCRSIGAGPSVRNMISPVCPRNSIAFTIAWPPRPRAF